MKQPNCKGYKDGRSCPREAHWLDDQQRPTCGHHEGYNPHRFLNPKRTAHWDAELEAYVQFRNIPPGWTGEIPIRDVVEAKP